MMNRITSVGEFPRPEFLIDHHDVYQPYPYLIMMGSDHIASSDKERIDYLFAKKLTMNSDSSTQFCGKDQGCRL